MNAQLLAEVQAWILDDPDPKTAAALTQLIESGDEESLKKYFAGFLQFGTAGLRGPLGPGPSCMNRAVVGRTAAGLVAYMKERGMKRVVIGRDARYGSEAFTEESAQIFGASSFRILKDVVTPIIRPGLAVIFVWSFVQAWGNFLAPFILIRDINKQPAAVMMYSFYNDGGQAVFRTVAAFSLIYTIPVLAMYFYVNKKYGFRFYGGIKG
jgi:hypothetical protein